MSMARLHDLPCRKAVELVTDYLEGRLPDKQRARFERHLANCPHCTEYVEQMRVTIRLLGRLDAPTLDESTRSALVGLYEQWIAG
jgi:anti-sigma factor RsiW